MWSSSVERSTTRGEKSHNRWRRRSRTPRAENQEPRAATGRDPGGSARAGDPETSCRARTSRAATGGRGRDRALSLGRPVCASRAHPTASRKRAVRPRSSPAAVVGVSRTLAGSTRLLSDAGGSSSARSESANLGRLLTNRAPSRSPAARVYEGTSSALPARASPPGPADRPGRPAAAIVCAILPQWSVVHREYEQIEPGNALA